MGTAALVGLGLRAPGRPGFPSLGRGTEVWFVSGERRAFPVLRLLGADEVTRFPAPFSLVDSLTGRARGFPARISGHRSSGFFCVPHFFGGREPLV